MRDTFSVGLLSEEVVATGSTTARSLAARFGDVLNVKDYGAVGDGAADDTAAIQEALHKARDNRPRGGIVFCPKGTYLITSSLIINADTILMGEGSFGGRATKLLARTDITMLTTPGVSGVTYEACDIIGIHFENTATTVTNYHVHLINPILCTVERCYFRSDPDMTGSNVGGLRGTRNGGSFGDAHTIYVSRCLFNHASIAVNSITDCQIVQNEIWGTNRVFAVEFVNSASSSMIACDLIAGTTAAVVITGTKNQNYEYRFFNVDFASPNTNGGAGCSFTDVERTKIIGCTFTANDEQGLRITDSDNIGIIGNSFLDNNDDDNSFDDILITGVSLSPRRIQIIGNTFERTGTTDTNLGNAIRLLASGATPQNINIAFNTIEDTTEYTVPAIVANLADTDTVFENDGGGITNTTRQGGRLLDMDYFQDNVAASQVAVPLRRGSSGVSQITSYTMSYPGSVIAISVRSNAARTAGTLTVEVIISGSDTGLTAVLDGTNTTVDVTTQDADLDTFSTTSQIAVRITTDASWLPVTADISVEVTVEV